jgi:hypothetical protein
MRSPLVKFETFKFEYLSQWIRTHGQPIRLLAPAEPRFTAPPGAEPDLTTYSFDRALVTADNGIAAMLVANNFHFEHNCAVLSTLGYPSGRLDTILAMLRRNPALTVYALHDASAAGCQLPVTLRRPEWFPDRTVVIFDLGLRPRHVVKKRWMQVQTFETVLTDEARKLLTRREIAWLDKGRAVELAALRPDELLRAVQRTIARAAPAASKESKESRDGGGGGDVWVDPGGPGGRSRQDTGDDSIDPAADDFADGGDFDGGDVDGADSFG